MLESLKGRVAVITGSSAGIGAAAAVLFAKHGGRVVLHGRAEDKLQQVKARCVAAGAQDTDVLCVQGDLSDDSTIEKLIKNTLDTFGTVHTIVNNAGYVAGGEGPLSMHGTVEGMDAQYRITVRVPYMLVQGFSKELVKNKGVIIMGSSGYSAVADPAMTCYVTMKAALDQFTKILAIEYAQRGVRVNSYNPGFVQTDIGRIFGEGAKAFWESRQTLTPVENKLATEDDIANVVAFLASDASAALSGSTVFCDRATTLTSHLVQFTDFK